LAAPVTLTHFQFGKGQREDRHPTPEPSIGVPGQCGKKWPWQAVHRRASGLLLQGKIVNARSVQAQSAFDGCPEWLIFFWRAVLRWRVGIGGTGRAEA